jgi:type III secretion protein N (ATPase)
MTTLASSDPLQRLVQAAQRLPTPVLWRGRVVEALGALVKATGLRIGIGELCELRVSGGRPPLLAEVVGVTGEATLLAPFGELDGLSRDTEVRPLGRRHQVPVGDHLLGRVVNGFGTAYLDRPNEAMPTGAYRPISDEAPSPLRRIAISQGLSVGVRAIDGLLTTGIGQRVGIFAPAGCGSKLVVGFHAFGYGFCQYGCVVWI